MSALTRFLNKRKMKQNKNLEEQSKLYRLVSNISIFGVFIAVGLLVLGIFKIFTMNTFMFGVISTIAIISISCLLILPWIRIFEKGEQKKVAIIFMIFVLVCTVLWLISVYMGIGIYQKAKAGTDGKSSLINTLRFVKITLIVSLQFLMSSLIASTVIKYRNKMVIFQGITYLSNVFFDFYVTCFLLCLSISSDKGLEISEKIKFLGNKFIVVMFILSIIYMAISSKVMQSVEERRFKHVVEDNYNIDGTARIEKPEQNNSLEEKLEALKNMFDKNLISQEDYDKKREEILKDM